MENLEIANALRTYSVICGRENLEKVYQRLADLFERTEVRLVDLPEDEKSKLISKIVQSQNFRSVRRDRDLPIVLKQLLDGYKVDDVLSRFCSRDMPLHANSQNFHGRFVDVESLEQSEEDRAYKALKKQNTEEYCLRFIEESR